MQRPQERTTKMTSGLVTPWHKETFFKPSAMNTRGGAMAALDRAAARFAPTVPQRNAFKTYWLQRLHMTNTRGVAELIFQQMPFCKGDDALPPFAVPDPFPATMDMAHPNPRPVSFPLTNDQSTNLPNTQMQNNAINRNRVEGTN